MPAREVNAQNPPAGFDSPPAGVPSLATTMVLIFMDDQKRHGFLGFASKLRDVFEQLAALFACEADVRERFASARQTVLEVALDLHKRRKQRNDVVSIDYLGIEQQRLKFRRRRALA